MNRLAIVLVLVAFASGAGAIAYGGIPDSNGVIHACVRQGELRVIDTEAGQSCKSKEQPLEWNQAGPPGGVSGYQIITSEVVTLSPGGSGEAQVTCPGSTRAIGGGYIADPTVQVTSVIPAGAGTVWSAAGRNSSDTFSASLKARAICADMSS